jgi:4-hydroxybenzoyl-CoA thioesterase
MYVNRRSVTIEWRDCDPAGIVFYPRYFAMFDASTAALFASGLGLNKREMIERYGVIGFPMVETNTQFLKASRFGDVVAIESAATKIGRSSFGIAHRMYRPDGLLCIEATEMRVWAARDPEDPDRILGVEIPDAVRAALSQGPTTPYPKNLT